jgi:hypothetical protein
MRYSKPKILRLRKLKRSLTNTAYAFRGVDIEVYTALVCARLFAIRALRAVEKSKAKKSSTSQLGYFFNPENRSRSFAPVTLETMSDEHRDEIRSIMLRLDKLSAFVQKKGLKDSTEKLKHAIPEFEELTNLSLYLIDKYGLKVLEMPIALTDPTTEIRILSINLKHKLKERKKYFNRLASRFEKLQNMILADGLVLIENGTSEPHPDLEEMMAVLEALQSEFGLELPEMSTSSAPSSFTSKHRN